MTILHVWHAATKILQQMLQLHFLPVSKQLCFILSTNFVRIYELTSTTMQLSTVKLGPIARLFEASRPDVSRRQQTGHLKEREAQAPPRVSTTASQM